MQSSSISLPVIVKFYPSNPHMHAKKWHEEWTLKLHALKVRTTFNWELRQTKRLKIMFEKIKDNDRLCTNHMTNKRLVMNESYKHWRSEMHHSWPIFKFKILLLRYKIPVTIIVTGILWWCHWYNYCTSNITTLVPQREKLMLHLLWPTCHQRFFPFFTLLGIKDNGEQECLLRIYHSG